jgi:monoamine oxidase
MGRSPLFKAVRRFLRRAHAANTLGLSPDEAASATPYGPSRRDVLLGSLVVPLAAACGDNLPAQTEDPGPGIAIIGGGIAGLTAAHFLRLAGVRAEVYEASMRIGGRMWTDRESLADSGQLVELGGELIDTDHVVIQALMTSHGLDLDDLPVATEGLEQDLFFMDGAPVPAATLVAQFQPVAAKMASVTAMSEGTDPASTMLFERIDNMSIPEWLGDATVGAGLAPTALIRRVLEVAYLEEFGLEVAEQSAWNLLTLIDFETVDPFHIFGDSDERYHTHQGNDALPAKMAARLDDRIHLDHALTKVVKGTGGYSLTFSTAGGEQVIEAAHVVFALPFTRLRDVDLAEAGLSEDKLTVIEELGYGTNAKLMLQFARRPWETGPRASNGSVITNAGDGAMLGSGLQTTWATSRGQDGLEGILTNFVGGQRGIAIGEGTPESQAQKVLPWIEQVFPGTQAQYVAGSAVRMHWPTYPFTKGSYASYKKGQWAFFGTEGAREDNAHFCGEHCSEDYQGYMEGGAETGAMVAAELLDDLEIDHPPALASLVGMLTTERARASYHRGFGERMKLSQIRRRAYR